MTQFEIGLVTLAILVAGDCAGAGPTRKPVHQPESFAPGEANGLVMQWLRARPWTQKVMRVEFGERISVPRDQPLQPGQLPRYRRESRTIFDNVLSDCLTYHDQRDDGAFQEYIVRDRMWEVTHG